MRQSYSKYKEKDMYRPRFAVNLSKTFEQLLKCSAEDKERMMYKENYNKNLVTSCFGGPISRALPYPTPPH